MASRYALRIAAPPVSCKCMFAMPARLPHFPAKRGARAPPCPSARRLAAEVRDSTHSRSAHLHVTFTGVSQ